MTMALSSQKYVQWLLNVVVQKVVSRLEHKPKAKKPLLGTQIRNTARRRSFQSEFATGFASRSQPSAGFKPVYQRNRPVTLVPHDLSQQQLHSRSQVTLSRTTQSDVSQHNQTIRGAPPPPVPRKKLSKSTSSLNTDATVLLHRKLSLNRNRTVTPSRQIALSTKSRDRTASQGALVTSSRLSTRQEVETKLKLAQYKLAAKNSGRRIKDASSRQPTLQIQQEIREGT